MNSTAMSLSFGGFGQCGQSSEELSKDLMTTSRSWGADENACDTRTALQGALTENLPPSNNPYGFKGVKRKRLSSNAVCKQHLLSLENDSGLLLGLGRMASEVKTRSRSSTRRMLMKGMEEEALPMELGLGLIRPTPDGLLKSCMPPLISGGRSALTSVDSDFGIRINVNQIPAVAPNPLLGLRRLQCSLGGAIIPGNDGAGSKGLVTGNRKFTENNPGKHSLPANSAVLTISDCVSGMSFGSGNGGASEDIRSGSCHDEHIPVADEGSTSARTVKRGGYMTSLLMGRKLDSVASCEASIGRLGIGLANHGDVSQADLFTNFRSSTGTTSTSGASVSLADRAPKICRFRGCGKGARGASGLCIAHGGGRRCQKQGCNKGAEGQTVYCKAHGGGRRCESLGCTKSAEGKTDYCIGHGGGRRCSQNGCSKAARGKSGLCIRHGGGKRCQIEGCTKSAEGYSGLCISHGGGRRCQFPDCGKGAQGSTMLCKAHGGGKRCMIQGCNKGAEGSTPLCKGHGGGKRCMFDGGGMCTKSVHGATSYCVAHGGGKRCAVQGCTKSARGRTDFCVRHGGGKRCRSEYCTKSAQGSTDFCKAHGGGKRCSWGQEDSPFTRELLQDIAEDLLKRPCDRFARGRIGLCAAHSALVQDRRVHGAVTVGDALSPGLGPHLFCGLVSGSGSVHKGTKSHSSSDTMKSSDYGDHSLEGQRSANSLMQACVNYRATGGETADVGDVINHSQESSETSILKRKPTESVAFDRCNLNTFNLENEPLNDLTACASSSNHKTSSCWPTFGNPSQHTMDVSTGKSCCPNFLLLLQDPETPEMGDANSMSMSYRPLIPSQVLVPLSMQKGELPVSHTKGDSGHRSRLNVGDGGTFNMPSLSLQEERVHGGKIMTVK